MSWSATGGRGGDRARGTWRPATRAVLAPSAAVIAPSFRVVDAQLFRSGSDLNNAVKEAVEKRRKDWAEDDARAAATPLSSSSAPGAEAQRRGGAEANASSSHRSKHRALRQSFTKQHAGLPYDTLVTFNHVDGYGRIPSLARIPSVMFERDHRLGVGGGFGGGGQLAATALRRHRTVRLRRGARAVWSGVVGPPPDGGLILHATAVVLSPPDGVLRLHATPVSSSPQVFLCCPTPRTMMMASLLLSKLWRLWPRVRVMILHGGGPVNEAGLYRARRRHRHIYTSRGAART